MTRSELEHFDRNFQNELRFLAKLNLFSLFCFLNWNKIYQPFKMKNNKIDNFNMELFFFLVKQHAIQSFKQDENSLISSYKVEAFLFTKLFFFFWGQRGVIFNLLNYSKCIFHSCRGIGPGSFFSSHKNQWNPSFTF